ncbi:MAG: ABC transporter substrate-binding protein, partial [Pseudomonadota bacterium]|nr:ABC transporter substrate-binding protein [Pseudomonadota bacterium]
EQVAGIPVVGTLFEPDFEKIAAARADVIVVGGRSVAQARPLAGIAPVLDMSIGPDAVGDGLARVAAYGALTGHAEQAEALATEVHAKLDTARARVAGQGGALILMTNGPKLSVFGRGSRFGWLHSRLGWPEAVEHIAASPHGEPVSFEYLAKANPDWLIVIDRGQAVSGGPDSARATLDNDLMRGVTAVQTGQVLYLDPADIYVAAGGVGAMGRTLDQIIAALPPAQ